jgi:hypothetical protein
MASALVAAEAVGVDPLIPNENRAATAMTAATIGAVDFLNKTFIGLISRECSVFAYLL